MFCAHFASLGLDIGPEESINVGRLGMAACFNGPVYLFELKAVELEAGGGVLEHVKARRYAGKYRDRNEPIHLVGVEFSRDWRAVAGFGVEMV